MRLTLAARLLIVLGLVAALALSGHPAQAATYNVGCDPDPAVRTADLIAAINSANATAANDTINLTANCVYSLTAVDNSSPGIIFMGKVAGDSGLPVIADAAASGALTLAGNNALITRDLAAPDFRLLVAASGADVTITDLALTEGRANSYGGCIASLGTLRLERVSMGSCTTVDNGISNILSGGALMSAGILTVIDSSFAGNSAAGDGGAIYQSDGLTASLTVTGTTFLLNQTGNVGLRYGGAIAVYSAVSISDSTFQENLSQYGGAIALDQVLTKSKQISGSTFVSNEALLGGALYGGNTLAITNSTFSGNRAFTVLSETGTIGGRGGAVWSQGNLTITHSTITGNVAEAQGGGLHITGAALSSALKHTLIAANNAPASPDASGNIVSQGYNLIGDSSGATISGVTTGNLLDGAASPLNLGALADNGGPTQTIALLPGSVALNAGDPGFMPPPDHDQRGAGFPRISAGRIDIGAYELACPTFPAGIADGDAAGLIFAIDCANASPSDEIITLATNGNYTLVSINNSGLLTIGGNDYSSQNGLPIVRPASTSGALTIDGAGATLIRSAAAPDFRFFQVDPGGNLTLTNLTLSGGRGAIYGGAIASSGGMITLQNSTLTDNRPVNTIIPRGGAIYLTSGTLTATDTTFSLNQAALGGAIALEANNTATFTRGRFDGNSASDSGGGLFNYVSTVSVRGTVFDGNSARFGGAVYINGSTTTLIDAATFVDNTASVGPGGPGGAIYADTTFITLSNSTLANNSANNGGAIVALFTDLTVVNSTIAGNSATTSGGGVLHNLGRTTGGGLTLAHVTITGNSAGVQGGGLSNSGDAVNVALKHTLIAGNTAPIGPDVSGAATSQGYNLIGDSSGATITGVTTGNLLDGAASPLNLGVLADNGGPTQTLALLPGSVALDAGDPGFTPPPDHDQRGAGFPRISGGRIDIGAYEAQDSASLTLTLALQGRPTPPTSQHVVTVHIELRPSGGGAPIWTGDATSDASGVVSVAELPTGSYTLWIKGTHTLARTQPITLTSGTNAAATALLLEGDATDSNLVNISDFSILAAAFGSSFGQPTFSAQADFNGDAAVNISDFSLLAANFSQSGAP
ncbi:MAG: hypothetical protein JNL42_01830 [Anaerolineae bacterium]|nr:hypothetical protein [Anaerolineae bacterium]